MSEFSFDYTLKDGSRKQWNEVIRRHWDGDKVVAEKVFRTDNHQTVVHSENIERLQTIHTYVDKAFPVEIIVERAVPVEHIVEQEVEFHFDRIVQKVRPVERIVERIEEVDVHVEHIVHKVNPIIHTIERVEDVHVHVDRIVQRANPVERILEVTNTPRLTETSRVETHKIVEGISIGNGSTRRKSGRANKEDLTVVEGIGPKIAELLNQADIWTFEDLAFTSAARLREILEAGGSRFQMHNPETWARQAALASVGNWESLRAWQDVLNAGKLAGAK